MTDKLDKKVPIIEAEEEKSSEYQNIPILTNQKGIQFMTGNINIRYHKSLEMNHMTEKLMFFHLPLLFIKLLQTYYVNKKNNWLPIEQPCCP